MSYEGLLRDHFEHVEEEYCGSYQGDIVFRVEDKGRIGYLVWGYGSCSGCDELEAAYGDEEAEREIGQDMANAVFFGTVEEIRAHALTKDGNQWYSYDSEVRETIEKLFPVE
jgi:hypothetical protein